MIERIDAPTADEVEFLNERIWTFNVDATGVDEHELLTFLVREGGIVVGGVHGWTWGTSVWIEALWVDPAIRSTGTGTQLMVAAEAEAARRRCTVVALLTRSFQARPFYERLGYEVAGAVDDYPAGHGLFLMRKALGPR